ncbi:hypothetical protein DRW07_08660 [Alteromonas sediminis]|uniref:SGNH hydrolase-type esterase domain-containing protein n=1 Tax=Alteromonas sediminis TaxID=2259342 RepID=A0A3N5Z9A4_9ALTE|nr:hypothetical protein [Alteromonas sediminis]RPJ67574.1 hypothetical protein DRW07_08660 [Alteromonas sediminis]
MRQQRLFTLIAISLPILLLLLTEAALKLANFGHTYPVFVEADFSEDYLMPNPELIKRFFHQGAVVPNVSPDTFYFKREKPSETIRIVVMGGSTAAGFPYGRFGSPAGLLTHQIRAVYPFLNVEIIPVAMASINSYALRDMAKEIIDISPDAVLIYTGHNEYLGVMGVGSAFANKGSHTTNLLFLALKELRLFQLLQTLINQPVDAHNISDGRTTMAAMAKEQRIPYQSDIYHKGITQFRNNLSNTLSQFSNEEIPVFIGNLVANERDQKPFASTDPASFPGILPLLRNRMATQAKLDNIQAWQNAQPYSANVAYAKGSLLIEEGKHEDALVALQQATDYDELRFRAPSAFNTIINQATANNDVHLVDIVSQFRHQATQGIIGSDLMLEHLHPTLRGYFVIANSYLGALVDKGILPAPSYPMEKSAPFRWQQVPLTPVDRLVAEYKIVQLTSDYPFAVPSKPVPPLGDESPYHTMAQERLDGKTWLAQQQSLLSLYQQQKEWKKAAQVAALLFEALPTNKQAAEAAAMLYLRAKEHRLAWYYARQALTFNPTSESIALALAQAQYRSEDETAAMQTLEELLIHHPDNQQAQRYLNNLKASQ